MWDQLVEAGMTTDVSWARSANAYDRLFIVSQVSPRQGDSVKKKNFRRFVGR